MGCRVGISNRRNWWSTVEPTMSEGATFRLNKYISSTRFEVILSSLRYMGRKDVEYNAGFYHICQMEKTQNINMAEEFSPSWIHVLDESMMEWFNKYAPVFTCICCKHHPFVNERHTICFWFNFCFVVSTDSGRQISPSIYWSKVIL